MKLLHIDSSILADGSVSRELSRATVDRLKGEIPGLEITYRDVAAVPIPHLSGATFLGGQELGLQPDAALLEDLALGNAVLDEFLAADIVVIGVGFYNFSIPSQLKSWIDRISVVGKTFRYGESGPVGLAGGKRVILTVARGGWYGPGSPMATNEHAETYLRSIFGFFAITDIEVIAAEKIAMGPAFRADAIQNARHEIAGLKGA